MSPPDTQHPHMRTYLILAVALLLGACDQAGPSSPDSSHAGVQFATAERPALRALRAATAQYRRVEQAEAAGYEVASPCVSLASDDGTELAAMGYHYLNESLLFDGAVDPTAPELLLYEPTEKGRLRLVGAEFMVAADAWTSDAPPSFEGVTFAAHLTPDVQHGIPFPHYDLHVWAWEPNPDGMFAPFNPQVSCAEAL